MLHPRVDIEFLEEQGAAVRMNPALLRRLGAPHLAHVNLCFGQARREVDVIPDSSMARWTVGVGAGVAEALCLPEGLPWEITAIGSELILGPFMGILRYSTSDEFNLQTLTLLKDRTHAYPQLRGVIFAFAADQLAREDGLCDGHYFDPEGAAFKPATLPLPAAVFRHVPLAPSDRDRLGERFGATVFNAYHPDKYEVYQWTVGDADLAPHLPLMRWFTRWDEIEEIVGDDGQVIVRPMSEAEAWATVLLKRQGDGWLWRHRVHREWQTHEGSAEEIEAAMRAHLDGRACLVQQWPFPMRQTERWMDFHVRVQKGITAHWKITAMIARRSGIGAPVANVSAGGMAEAGEEALRDMLKLDEAALYQLKQRIFDLALKVGERLDSSGVHLGDIAVDVSLDLDRKIWIHNVNARVPDPTVGLDVGDRMLYYRLVTEPLFYTKALAGFAFPQ